MTKNTKAERARIEAAGPAMAELGNALVNQRPCHNELNAVITTMKDWPPRFVVHAGNIGDLMWQGPQKQARSQNVIFLDLFRKANAAWKRNLTL